MSDALDPPGSSAFAAADIRSQLRLDEKGRIVPEIDNAVAILTQDQRWRGVLGYNEFSGTIVKLREPPIPTGTGDWEDIDDAELRLWLCAEFGMAKLRDGHFLNAIDIAAHRHSFHEVRDYLLALTWDQVPRVRYWLHAFLGAADTPYTQRAGEIWLVSAVARILKAREKDGTKVDHVLILEGPTGLGKSDAFRALGAPWFTDAPFRLDNPVEAAMIIRGMWIVELAELDSFNRAESSAAKRFFSQQADRFRSPYGHRVSTVNRQCVFGGSVNHREYLKDDTGNRRYMPVLCDRVDAAELRDERDQLWAEAVALFKSGTTWWPSAAERPLFEAEQEMRHPGDAWEQVISYWLQHNPGTQTVTTRELLGEALKLEVAKWTKSEQTRVGTIMQRLGWPKRRRAEGGLREYVYERPEGWPGSPERQHEVAQSAQPAQPSAQPQHEVGHPKSTVQQGPVQPA